MINGELTGVEEESDLQIKLSKFLVVWYQEQDMIFILFLFKLSGLSEHVNTFLPPLSTKAKEDYILMSVGNLGIGYKQNFSSLQTFTLSFT